MENENSDQQGRRPNPVRRSGGMANFRARQPSLALQSQPESQPVGLANLTGGGGESLQMISTTLSTQPQLLNRFFTTSLILANDDDVPPLQTVAYYLSALALIYPRLKIAAEKWVTTEGFQVEYATEVEDLELLVTLAPWKPFPELAMLFGQITLLMFKNINVRNYDQFISRRIQALRAEVGACSTSNIQESAVFSLKKAEVIRGMLGSDVEIKREILLLMLNCRESPGPFGRAASYVCGILEWNEMTAICMIHKMLILTKSPVLGDPEIRSEVLHLREAFEEVIHADYPQYYRIMENRSRCRILERQNFAILTTVAQLAYRDQAPTIAQFVPAASENNPTVVRLLMLHRRFLAQSAPDMHNPAVEYLCNIEYHQINKPMC